MVYTVGQFVWPVALWIVAVAAAVVGIVVYNKKAARRNKLTV